MRLTQIEETRLSGDRIGSRDHHITSHGRAALAHLGERRRSCRAISRHNPSLVARFVIEQNFVFNGARSPALPVQGNDARPELIEVEYHPPG
jgi:hypothetical protein